MNVKCSIASILIYKKHECLIEYFKSYKNTRNGASVLTELNEKCSKIKDFKQSMNGIKSCF